MASGHVDLSFSGKYIPDHASHYHSKHRRGFARRISNWREQRIAARALHLAGSPEKVLDLPCGTGRFWRILAADPQRQLFAGDYSQAMIDVALATQPQAVRERFVTMQTSAFAIDLPDAAVDCVFCMRLLHHIGSATDRQAILREFRRVTRRTVVVSLWTSGNLQALRRARRDGSRTPTASKNRYVADPHDAEREFEDVGYRIVGHIDMLRYISMWRVYVLEKNKGVTQ